jgi:dTDP-4-dehydrorhamnose 3,5-epimerase
LAVYIPRMFAHGFQTLEEGTEVFYQMSEFYTPNLSTGLRYNDPRLGIEWPLAMTAISDRDQTWALL